MLARFVFDLSIILTTCPCFLIPLQPDIPVNEETILLLFEGFGNVLDVAIKSCKVDPVRLLFSSCDDFPAFFVVSSCHLYYF